MEVFRSFASDAFALFIVTKLERIAAAPRIPNKERYLSMTMTEQQDTTSHEPANSGADAHSGDPAAAF